MAFGSFGSGGRNAAPMAEINVTPLVDVMLVLLVIFIIAAPFMASRLALELPRAGRFRAWAELTHTDAAGEISGQSKIIYYFRDHGDHHRLEMQSVIAPVLPRFQALAQSIRKASSGAAAGHH